MSIYIYIHVCTHAYIHTYIQHTHVYMYICGCVCYTHIHIHACMHAYIHIWIHMHTPIYSPLRACMCQLENSFSLVAKQLEQLKPRDRFGYQAICSFHGLLHSRRPPRKGQFSFGALVGPARELRASIRPTSYSASWISLDNEGSALGHPFFWSQLGEAYD